MPIFFWPERRFGTYCVLLQVTRRVFNNEKVSLVTVGLRLLRDSKNVLRFFFFFFFSCVRAKTGSSGPGGFLAEIVETGDKNRDVPQRNGSFCEVSLGKIGAKYVELFWYGPQILSLTGN